MGQIMRLQDKDGNIVDYVVIGTIPYCDRCGGGSELLEVHGLMLCSECAELYNKQYPTFVKVFMETKEKAKGKK